MGGVVYMDKRTQKLKVMMECMKEPMLAILAALLISSFVISHTQVPTESMLPTISPGNHLIVNRLPYYYRNPVCGEIVVFEYNGKNLIKRVIGTAGDIVDLKDGKVYVNGKALEESSYLKENDQTFTFTQSPIRFPYTVPEGFCFVLGDNRTNSSDSRVIGAIPTKSIIAQAGYRVYPLQSIGFVD